MDPMVQEAVAALIRGMATDAWQQVKHAVTGVWRRLRPEDAEQAGAELDELRQQVLQAGAGRDLAAEQALEQTWQLKLQGLLEADPAAAEELRQVLDRVMPAEPPAAGQSRAGATLMTGTSRDSSTFTQIGTQVNYGRP